MGAAGGSSVDRHHQDAGDMRVEVDQLLAHVRIGSTTDIAGDAKDVRFTPESGHRRRWLNPDIDRADSPCGRATGLYEDEPT